MLNLRYFALPRTMDCACSFTAVCGSTWGQGMEAVLELAASATSWAESNGVDPQHDRLMEVWREAIGLAWATELTARCHLMPAPYLAWEAGMLLAAVALSEQLRLLATEEEARSARLGPSAIRQLENLVIQHDFEQTLSLVSAVRKGSYLGPWPALSLGYRLSQSCAPLEWAEGLLEQIECLSTSRVMQRCVATELRRNWSEFVDLSRRAWLAGLAAGRRRQASTPI
jgi:hypothetical protein